MNTYEMLEKLALVTLMTLFGIDSTLFQLLAWISFKFQLFITIYVNLSIKSVIRKVTAMT